MSNFNLSRAMPPETKPDLLVSATSSPLAIKSLALNIIATIGVIFALDWAQSFVATLLLGILFSYTLNPLVVWLEKYKIPRFIGASIVITSVLFSIVFAGYSLGEQAQSIVSKLPEAAAKLTSKLSNKQADPLTNIQKVQIAASAVEKATSSVGDSSATSKKSTLHVVVDEPKFKVNHFLWQGSLGLFGFVGETVMMIFLAYFLLLSGDTFKRKLVRLTGPTLSSKKITIHILDDINHSIQRYMFMLLTTNIMVGLLSWVLFRMIGLENAGAWAVVAGLLHVIPYFGPVATAAATGMAGYMQFDSILLAVQVAGASVIVATIIGVFVTTWMTGRIAKMNATAVFVSILFWS